MTTLIADLIDRAQQLADRVDPAFRARALSAVDEAIQWYSSQVPWDALKDREDFTTDGTEYLVLPDRIDRVLWVADVANQRYVGPGNHWVHRVPGQFLQGTSGNAYEWRQHGTVPVIEDPADGTLDFETSVSEAMSVSVRGMSYDSTASGTALELYEVQETVDLGGAAVTTTNSFRTIKSIQKEKATSADVIVKLTASGKQVSRIPAWATRPLFNRIELLNKPAAGTQLRIEYMRRPDRITSESDTLHPAINEEAVMWRAAGNLHWHENEPQAAQLAWRKAEEVVTDRKNVEDKFGDKDHHIEPFTSYMQMEGIDEDTY